MPLRVGTNGHDAWSKVRVNINGRVYIQKEQSGQWGQDVVIPWILKIESTDYNMMLVYSVHIRDWSLM